MATTITRGTQLDGGGAPLDVWEVERITRAVVDGQTGFSLEVRTRRQRCFPRALTGTTTWSEAYVRAQVAQGALVVLLDRALGEGRP